MENNRRGASSESGQVAAPEDVLAEQDEIVIKDGWGEGELDAVDMSDLLPKEEDIKVIKKALEENDKQTLIDKIRKGELSYIFLQRLVLELSDEQIYPNDTFVKLVDVLAEYDYLNGISHFSLSKDLSKELTDEKWARYYSVLKKAELVLTEKQLHCKEGTPDSVVERIRNGKLSKLELDLLTKEYAIEFKDITALDIVTMVRKGKLHKSVLECLAKEYAKGKEFTKGREAPADLDEKIKEALKILDRYDAVLKKAELVLKDKTAREIVALVRQGKVHQSVIEHLAEDYLNRSREIPGDMNEKIKEALNELEK